MKCSSCHVEMEQGMVMEPIWGNAKAIPQIGDTVWPISAALSTNCMKCPQCGHTISWTATNVPVLMSDPHLKAL
jgi:hypothetical protein